jgi:hypothetical protein
MIKIMQGTDWRFLNELKKGCNPGIAFPDVVFNEGRGVSSRVEDPGGPRCML